MKMNILAVLAVASLLVAGTAFAQNGSGNGQRGQGKGCGGSLQSSEAPAARQAAGLEKRSGICPQGGPGLGRGKGQGQGKGLRDGTGPQGKAQQQRGVSVRR